VCGLSLPIFVLCSNIFSEHLRDGKDLRASQPNARGPGRSSVEVALATLYMGVGIWAVVFQRTPVIQAGGDINYETWF
jgi:hypothetical protein